MQVKTKGIKYYEKMTKYVIGEEMDYIIKKNNMQEAINKKDQAMDELVKFDTAVFFESDLVEILHDIVREAPVEHQEELVQLCIEEVGRISVIL